MTISLLSLKWFNIFLYNSRLSPKVWISYKAFQVIIYGYLSSFISLSHTQNLCSKSIKLLGWIYPTISYFHAFVFVFLKYHYVKSLALEYPEDERKTVLVTSWKLHVGSLHAVQWKDQIANYLAERKCFNVGLPNKERRQGSYLSPQAAFEWDIYCGRKKQECVGAKK